MTLGLPRTHAAELDRGLEQVAGDPPLSSLVSDRATAVVNVS